MISLGINEDLFDSGVVLCEDGHILFAANEERYTRRKNEGGFPHQSLAAMFSYTGIEPEAIDQIYMVGHMTPPFPVRLCPFLHSWLFEAKRNKRVTLFKRLMDAVTFLTPISHSSEDSRMRSIVRPLLPPVTRRQFPKPLQKTPLKFVEHHTAHAAGAWKCSGFDETLCITADGMGDGLSLTVSHCGGGGEQGIERLWAASSRDSFGLFFEVLAEGFGFTPCRDEGKVTGLAACGDPATVQEDAPLVMQEGRLHYTGPLGREGVRWVREKLLPRYGRENISAWAQDVLETQMTAIAQWWLKERGLRRLAVAGGVFANVKLNQRLHELPEVDTLFVYPNMGDGGLGLGAICAEENFAPRRIENVFLGESFDDDAIEAVLNAEGLSYEKPEDIETHTGALLAQGHIVARFSGRMEWGPRALGNRSILVRTTDRAVVDRLNTLLQRSDFMPFAPAVLAEDAELYCKDIEPGRLAAEFMTVCFDCTDRMKQEHPAIVHVDGTARAQLVSETTNPGFHKILKTFKSHSGSGVLLNTSFNIHEEPIVCTPHEAVRAFLSAQLDYLAIGPYIVSGTRTKKGQN